MNPLSPLFALIIYLIAFLSGYIINLKYKIVSVVYRYESIDGLRGFLALGVFIHHASIWYGYIKTGNWGNPNSNLYTHFGGTSVAFFFMITSFLFISKLINSSEKTVNWRAYFISRLYRLTPMYFITISILVLIIMVLSNWQLHVGLFKFIRTLCNWFMFRIVVNPEINNFSLTSIITGGVTWSLPFEWFFYFILPLIAFLFLKKKVPSFYIVLGILFIFIFSIGHSLKSPDLLSFFGGAVAPFILKYTSFKRHSNNVFITILILVCTVLAIKYTDASSISCKFLVAIIFTCVATGNTIFGILKSTTLKFLGEISYSTYLTHGIILFTTFYMGIGIDKAKIFSPQTYSAIIFLLTPVVIVVSFLGFRFIEKPFMNKLKIKII